MLSVYQFREHYNPNHHHHDTDDEFDYEEFQQHRISHNNDNNNVGEMADNDDSVHRRKRTSMNDHHNRNSTVHQNEEHLIIQLEECDLISSQVSQNHNSFASSSSRSRSEESHCTTTTGIQTIATDALSCSSSSDAVTAFLNESSTNDDVPAVDAVMFPICTVLDAELAGTSTCCLGHCHDPASCTCGDDTTIEAIPFDNDDEDYCYQTYERRRRPEYVLVNIRKPTPDASVGIAVHGSHRGEIYVDKVCPDGLIGRSKAPIGFGDKIIAVNGISTAKMFPHDIGAILKDSRTTVSILVHNPKSEHPNTMSSTVQKPSPNSSIGVTMKVERGALIVNRVNDDGIFADSLLVHGDRFYEINGFPCKNLTRPEEVIQIISSSPTYVTIVSQRRHKHGMATVLCTEPDKKYLKSKHFGREENKNKGSSSDDNNRGADESKPKHQNKILNRLLHPRRT